MNDQRWHALDTAVYNTAVLVVAWFLLAKGIFYFDTVVWMPAKTLDQALFGMTIIVLLATALLIVSILGVAEIGHRWGIFLRGGARRSIK